MFLWFEFSCVNRLDISINLSVGSRDRVRGVRTPPPSSYFSCFKRPSTHMQDAPENVFAQREIILLTD